MASRFMFIIFVLILFLGIFSGCTKTESDLTGSKTSLNILAYQLEHQLRSSFQAAYDSFINIERLSSGSQEDFAQIIAVFKASVKEIASTEEIDQKINSLKQIYQGGEGEMTFPTHEVVNLAEVIKKEESQALVKLKVTRYFPAREWSGPAYQKKFAYQLDLEKTDERWKINKIDYTEVQ